jgi:hypothetical protein
MKNVKTRARIVSENFIVKTCHQIRYMGYHGRAHEDLWVITAVPMKIYISWNVMHCLLG